MFEYFLQFIFIHNVKLLLFKNQYVVVFLLYIGTTETATQKIHLSTLDTTYRHL